MSTPIIVLPGELTSAATLLTQIQVFDPTVTTATLVMQGAITVGLNRLLSKYSTTLAQLTAIMVPALDATGSTISVTPATADADRIVAIVGLVGGSTTARVAGCASRTGLALLLGLNTSLPPLRTS